jgi:dihydroorotase
MGKTLIKNATLINEGKHFTGNLLINGNFIEKISKNEIPAREGTSIIDANGLWLIPGVIDDQVHFREPGLTHKAEIYTESRAAAAGGVTSFMEMPNTQPQTVTIDELEKKYQLASEKSLVNYSFYLGATNNNISEIRKINPADTCGLKVFMGSSTGNMLVDEIHSLEAIFSESPVLIATHCEDEATIRKNSDIYRSKYGENVPLSVHPKIRSEEACYLSSSRAVSLAEKYNSRLHILHISTEKELGLFRNDIPSNQKRITAEVCVHHLWFNESYYNKKGTLIKWNPAIKTEKDRISLFLGMLDNKLDVIATDHAPHTLEEKENPYFAAPSGGPLVQHSLVAMLEFVHNQDISIEKVVDKMCHKPAEIFQVHKRGFLREGFYADLVLVNPSKLWKVEKSNILYKCGWSPFEGHLFKSKVEKTFVNGELVYDDGVFLENQAAMRLRFDR